MVDREGLLFRRLACSQSSSTQKMPKKPRLSLSIDNSGHASCCDGRPVATMEPHVQSQPMSNSFRLAPIFSGQTSIASAGSINLPSIYAEQLLSPSWDTDDRATGNLTVSASTSAPYERRSAMSSISDGSSSIVSQQSSGFMDTLSSPRSCRTLDVTATHCSPPASNCNLMPSPPPSRLGKTARSTHARNQRSGFDRQQMDRVKRDDHKDKEKQRREVTKTLTAEMERCIPKFILDLITDRSRSFPAPAASDSGYGSDGDGAPGQRIGASRTNDNQLARNPLLLAANVYMEFKQWCDRQRVWEDEMTIEEKTGIVLHLTDKLECHLRQPLPHKVGVFPRSQRDLFR